LLNNVRKKKPGASPVSNRSLISRGETLTPQKTVGAMEPGGSPSPVSPTAGGKKNPASGEHFKKKLGLGSQADRNGGGGGGLIAINFSASSMGDFKRVPLREKQGPNKQEASGRCSGITNAAEHSHESPGQKIKPAWQSETGKWSSPLDFKKPLEHKVAFTSRDRERNVRGKLIWSSMKL